ncbi:unnamed protein product [Closterium sp. NIES-65]|nr:unnamed protein product [Closterium sp. NIES-65]
MKALDVCCWCRCLSDRLSLSFPHSLLIPSHSLLIPSHSLLIPFSSPSHSLLIPFSFPSHSLLIPFSSPFHSLLIPFSFPFYSLLIPCSSPSHSLLIPFSFPSHSLLIPFSFILIPLSSPSHPLLIPFSFPYHPLLIPFSFPSHFLLISFSFPSHSLLILLISFSFPSHSLPFSFPSHSFRIPFSSPSHPLLIPFSFPSLPPRAPLSCPSLNQRPAPWFTVLVAAWVLCGLGVAAWVLYWKHSQYEDYPPSLPPLLSLLCLNPLPAPWFTVLVAAWVLCGLAVAAWLLYWKHSQYEDHREEALGVWCKERALMLQQLVLTHVGQMQAGVVSNPSARAHSCCQADAVMGRLGQRGKWELDRCLNGSSWEAYLTRTAYARPGNTGASSCVFVTDEERASFERQHGTIKDNNKNVSAHRPIYCPKILDFSTVVVSNGSWHIDLMKRFSTEIPLAVAGKSLYTWPYPMSTPTDHAGFGLGFPLRRTVSPTNASTAAASTVYGTLATTVDVTSIAQKVLEELYAPDSSKSFEMYDVTDPSSLFAIVSPVPPHVYFRPNDPRPNMLPSPLSETRPWEGPAVVPLEELGAGVRKYEGWCRYTQPPNAWQSWGIPILIALFALLLVLLVLLAAWIQRAQFFQTQQHMAEADRLRKEAEDAEASKSMFVACMSHELRTPMTGIIGMLHALADMTLQPLDLSDPTCPYHVLLAPCSLLPSSLSPTRHARCFGRCYAPSFMHPSLSPTPPPGMLDALADMALQPPDLSDLLIARGCATDTLHLVNRVLDLAKLEAGRAVVDEAVTDVRQWLHGALHRHAEEARSKGIECRAVGDEMVVDVREWLHAALDRHVEAARSKGIECEWLFEISFQTQALVAGD